VRVLVVHQAVPDGAPPDERDVLDQAAAVMGAVRALGHSCQTIAATLDLEMLRRRLQRARPDVVFNLVEGLGGSDRLISLVPSLLDVLDLPYTGAPTEAIQLSTNKLIAKAWLRAAGVPVLPTLAVWPPPSGDGQPAAKRNGHKQAILKSVWEHGSRGLHDGSVVSIDASLAAHLEAAARQLGGEAFAEPFVDGRELNLSLLQTPDGVRVLPAAEILFVGYPTGKPRIVGARAKWEPDSREWVDTPRSFDFEPQDEPLVAELERIARRAWDALGLRGWARVDFRVDAKRRPWVLEVNANPCLAKDAGFAAALERAGLGFEQAIAWLLDEAHSRKRGRSAQATAVA
jgi:D-alanine-D-alanine ligase